MPISGQTSFRRAFCDALSGASSKTQFYSQLHRPDSGERAAVEIEQWAESDPALLEEAETIAHREHHEDAAKILQRAHDLATV